MIIWRNPGLFVELHTIKATVSYSASIQNIGIQIWSKSCNIKDKEAESLNLGHHLMSGVWKIRIKSAQGSHSGFSSLILNTSEQFVNTRLRLVGIKKKKKHWSIWGKEGWFIEWLTKKFTLAALRKEDWKGVWKGEKKMPSDGMDNGPPL